MSARAAGAVGFVAAAALPAVLWHRVIADIASQFRLEPTYLITGWTCWALMALGLLCLVPAGIGEWRDRSRRFHRRGTGAWYGWGVTRGGASYRPGQRILRKTRWAYGPLSFRSIRCAIPSRPRHR